MRACLCVRVGVGLGRRDDPFRRALPWHAGAIYVYGRAGARTAMYITHCAARENFGNQAGHNAQPSTLVCGCVTHVPDAEWERQEAAMAADRRPGLMDIATPLWSVSECGSTCPLNCLAHERCCCRWGF